MNQDESGRPLYIEIYADGRPDDVSHEKPHEPKQISALNFQRIYALITISALFGFAWLSDNVWLNSQNYIDPNIVFIALWGYIGFGPFVILRTVIARILQGPPPEYYSLMSVWGLLLGPPMGAILYHLVHSVFG